MKPTPKRMDPTRRGRFNIGEKEVVSVALEAEIPDGWLTVVFPAAGGRGVRRNRRGRGTVVTALLLGRRASRGVVRDAHAIQADRLPPGGQRQGGAQTGACVNRAGPPSDSPAERAGRAAEADPPGHGHRRSRPRRETGWLYELGIPIQAVDALYDVDVAQKVPMPPNRDTVGKAYLQDIYAEMLNAAYSQLRGEDFAAQWVRTALEDDRVTPAAVKAAVTGRYGEKVTIWSSDTDSNMRATEAGYEVLHPRSMSPEERKSLRERGEVRGALELFPPSGKQAPREAEDSELTEDHRAFARWTVKLAAFAGLDATVEFVFDKQARYDACCTASTDTPQVTYNLSRLEPGFFAERGPEQLALVIHELGHAHARRAMEHGPKWGRSCTTVGAMIALGLTSE